MIAPYRGPRCRSRTDWHEGFLQMLPKIRRCARVAFGGYPPEVREDLVQEVIANCMVVYARLAELGKTDIAYPTVLAKFGVRQVRDGRRVGNRLNVHDVLSVRAQRQKGFAVERLDRFDLEKGRWTEAIVPDDRRPVADQAAFRIDFPAWLTTISHRNRRIAEKLAAGCTSKEVARQHRLSKSRVSHIRRELRQSWNTFQGETVEGAG
jgi:hypothetical protein